MENIAQTTVGTVESINQLGGLLNMNTNVKEMEEMRSESTVLLNSWESFNEDDVKGLNKVFSRRIGNDSFYLIDGEGKSIDANKFRRLIDLVMHYGLDKKSTYSEYEIRNDVNKNNKFIIGFNVVIETKFTETYVSANRNSDDMKKVTRTKFKKIALTKDAVRSLLESSKLSTKEIANIGEPALVRLAQRWIDTGKIGTVNIEGMDDLERISLVTPEVSKNLAEQKLSKETSTGKSFEYKAIGAHNKKVMVSGSMRNLYEAINKDGLTELQDVNLFHVDLSTLSNATYNPAMTEEGKFNRRGVQRVQEKDSLQITKPVIVNGKVEEVILVNASEFTTFLSAIRFEGKELFYCIQTGSQKRVGKGCYALAGEESSCDMYLDIYSNGYYGAVRGKDIPESEIKRFGQNSSSSTKLIGKNDYKNLNSAIIDNPTLTIKFDALVADKKDGSLNKEEVIERRMIGDGMAVMGYKSACIFALNTGAIDRYEFDSLRGARFNLESRSPKLSRMAKKVVALYQLRPVKGIAILMPEREINRLMKEYHGLEGNFDIVYSRSMIKGGIEVDSLSKLASSKPAVNEGEEGARINQMFLESLSFFTNSASVVDEVSRLVKGEIDDIVNNTNSMYNSTNLNSAQFTLSRRASLFRTAGILGDARLLLQEGRESIDNLVKKGLSVHLPGTQYQYIMDDPYALLSKCNEWATKTTVEEIDKTEDGEPVYKVTGNVVTKRGGTVTLLRNPHNYFSAFVTRDSLSAEEAFTGDKAWMKLLFEQNIVMLPADEIVFYMDGADFDGDKAMVIYGEEYPSLMVSDDNLIIDFKEFFLPFYVEDGIGNYASRKMIKDVNIRTVSTSVLNSFGSVSQIGKISNRVFALNEFSIMILHEISKVVAEGKEAKAKGDENRVIELRKEYKQLSAELKIASRYAAKGNAFNQAEIDLKADPMLVNKFLKESEKLTFNGVETEITGVEFQNNKGLTLNECKSVPATLLKRTEGMVLEACEQIVINFIDIVTEVKNGRLNIFSKDVVKELGVLPMDKAKNDNMYKIAVSLMRDYNMEIKSVMDRFNDESSVLDTDDDRKEAIKHITDEYKKMLGDMSKDPVLAYYALVAVYDKMYSRYQSLVERVFNSESDMIKNDAQTNKLLMNQDMIERTKDYVMSNGDSRLGKIEIADGEFRFINYKNFMIELVSGTSFPYSVLTEGMLNLVPTVDLEAPNGVESVIVNEDNEMILIRSGFDSRVSNLQFIAEKEVKDEDTKDKYNIINLQSGIYEVLSGMVTIPKEVNKFDFVFEADRVIPTGQYAIRYNKESNAVTLNNNGEIYVVNKLSKVLFNSNKMKVNGEFIIFVKNVDGRKFSVGTNLDYINKRDEERKALELEKAMINEKANKDFNNTVISIVESAEQEDELDFLDSSIIDMYTSTLSMVEIKDTLDYSVSSLTEEDVILTEKAIEEQIEMEVYESDLEDEENKFSNLTNQELYNIVAMTLDNAEIALEDNLDFANDLNEAIYALENRSNMEYKNSNIVKAVKITIRELRSIDREINPTAILNIITDAFKVIEQRSLKDDFLSTLKFNENKEGEYIDEMFAALASM